MTTKIFDEGCGLYDSIVGFVVSEQAGVDAWGQLVQCVMDLDADGTSHDDIKLLIQACELQIMEDFSITAMPGAWRSAKSTALSAHKQGVPLIDENYKVRPKSVVADALAELKRGSSNAPAAPKEPEAAKDALNRTWKAFTDTWFMRIGECSSGQRVLMLKNIREWLSA
jgi:hypothetical protein